MQAQAKLFICAAVICLVSLPVTAGGFDPVGKISGGLPAEGPIAGIECPEGSPGQVPDCDADGDPAFPVGGDCDDFDANINSGAPDGFEFFQLDEVLRDQIANRLGHLDLGRLDLPLGFALDYQLGDILQSFDPHAPNLGDILGGIIIIRSLLTGDFEFSRDALQRIILREVVDNLPYADANCDCYADINVRIDLDGDGVSMEEGDCNPFVSFDFAKALLDGGAEWDLASFLGLPIHRRIEVGATLGIEFCDINDENHPFVAFRTEGPQCVNSL